MNIKNRVREITKDIQEDVIKWRRIIHKYPELAFQEERTSKFIYNLLEKWGYDVTKNIATTGVVANIDKNEDFTLALRFDMDALPIEEENNINYKSVRKGIMHACGHDAHIAIGLGTAYVLTQLSKELKGNVKLIFQPAEEGWGGAKKMVEEGVLENPTVDAILALHIWPDIEVGKIGVKNGPVMASADRFDITINGIGSHSGLAYQGIDPMIICSNIIQNIQMIVSREIPPVEPVVISIGTIHGGTTFNVIPSQIKMSGTVRTVNPEIRKEVLKKITEKVKVHKKNEVKFQHIFSSTINNGELTKIFSNFIEELWGKEKLIKIQQPAMTSEDFSEYLNRVPGMYFLLGTGKKGNKKTNPIHHPRFNIDEGIIPFGVEVLSTFTIKLLRRKNDERGY